MFLSIEILIQTSFFYYSDSVFFLFMQVLGDIVESIAGSILIDTEFCFSVVWRIFEQLLAPIISPDKLELQPLRELIELCSHLGYFISTTITNRGQEAIVELSVQKEETC